MFEAVLSNGSTLKKIFEGIKDLCTDVNFDVSSEGIKLQAMDSSHVSLVSLELHTDVFEQFRCDRDSMTLGLNMKSVTQIFKICGNDDSVTMRAEDEGETLEFTFEKGEDRVSTFELKLMDIDSEHLGIPDTEYQCNVKLPCSEYQRICRDMAGFGDNMTIDCQKGGVTFSVDGEVGKGKIFLKHQPNVEEKHKVIVTVKEGVELDFALRYLNNFAKAAPLSDHVQLGLNSDTPLSVRFDIEDKATLGSLKFFLAPKIKEGEDQ
ncbi:unnamed protein product [Vitrella brassicaformis CCMP3155]|uniref:DNA sliding clamp PCNA n=1 Tax=Vitrella brassicaformis (strain CCMP3155) TaxID=1169540 RepID=A0A0G4F8I2_VITBC|nr:unnamed protein product [Vitrella brassicaformis CCMP3155]|mmetsp:Transcript_27159/g.67728  ORF Transcript_27159/g.67728 Transcript_27159/m.67728 type:complete len:264 (-) Transcript_27159:122-913(-)|eukprot:CEM08400.1 unnamed protein product [Vitrella brassicaformis CCMP3155]